MTKGKVIVKMVEVHHNHFYYHKGFLTNINCLTDNEELIRYGIESVLIPYAKELGSIKNAICAYDAGVSSVKRAIANGKDCDAVTTGRDYSKDVINRMEKFK